MGHIWTSMSDLGSSLNLGKKWLVERQGSLRVVSASHLLFLFLGGFGNSFRVVFG